MLRPILVRVTPLRLLTLAIVSTALLAGCTPSAVEPSPTSVEASPSPSRSCEAGLVDALQSDLSNQHGANADAVSVREDATTQFTPAEIDSLIGCRLIISTPVDGGGTQLQVVGIAREGVTDALLELGWTQPFPDTEPFAFQAPDMASGLAVYDLSDPESLPLDFDGWRDFVDGGIVVIGSPGF